MTRIDLRFVLLALSLTSACVSTPRSARAPGADVAAITDEQLSERHYRRTGDDPRMALEGEVLAD